ncbi:uncharacterized protein LOC122132358 isoform X1 [Clupea harengus]|uniref:Uncharacterized protein LOC122132358 isoform X1 n=1 Tax=Clupea harengus TaxID=7950 RepID=A0A8M1KG79_CLUHA|nr:uncharacterized protein LOC122132358 isoform X1 [Clupea harengus]
MLNVFSLCFKEKSLLIILLPEKRTHPVSPQLLNCLFKMMSKNPGRSLPQCQGLHLLLDPRRAAQCHTPLPLPSQCQGPSHRTAPMK